MLMSLEKLVDNISDHLSLATFLIYLLMPHRISELDGVHATGMNLAIVIGGVSQSSGCVLRTLREPLSYPASALSWELGSLCAH
jgi:hypothetical protein